MRHVNQGDLFAKETVFMSDRRAGRIGVRASLVAVKFRNGEGAKGGGEVD